jgi:hypothetical protein
MHNAAKNLMFALLATTLPGSLPAQDELLDEQQAPIRQYNVEIVVFAYTEDVYSGSEIFPPDLIDTRLEESADIAEIAVRKKQRRHPDFIGLEPTLLAEEDFTMNKIVQQFERLDAYKLLMHVGWTQPGFPQSDTVAMDLLDFGIPPEGLHGQFSLYLGRYLHLIVDLTMDAPVAEFEYIVDDETAYVFSDGATGFGDQPPLRKGPVRYRLQEDRIIKNGEIRYFDHPKFGVVAKITRVEEAAEELPVQPPLIGRTAQ